MRRAWAYDIFIDEKETRAYVNERRRLGRSHAGRALATRNAVLDEMRSRDLSELGIDELQMILVTLEAIWPALRRTFPVNRLLN